MDDLISRQAAIDALDQIFDRCEEIEAHLPEGDPDRTGYKMYPDYMTVWKYLHQLPSAHPLNPCETCLHKGKGWDEDPCDGCTGTESKYEPDNGWIPVSERLPESGHDVIFCDSNGIVCRGIYSAITREWIGYQWKTIRYYRGVVAWMPLPEPYKEEER